MYEAFYKLREKPFSILPDPDLVYWGEGHRLAFSMLEFSVLNNAGVTVITGDIGSGKTTLIRRLLRKLDATMSVALISNTRHSRDDLLRWIMMALGQPYEGASYLALYERFNTFLTEEYAKRGRTVLIIDEAQHLGAEALEELRMLSNVNADKEQFLQLILVGQPQLKDLLQRPELTQFAQRVSSDFHLRRLSADEVGRYIEYRLRAVGAQKPLFSLPACKLIAEASACIPRTINILCDTALVYGYSKGADEITSDIVKAVIANKRKFGVFGPNGAAP